MGHMAHFYKIRNSEGKFSSGGAWPHFERVGKHWNSLGTLKQHLTLLMDYKRKIGEDWEIVEYTYEPQEVQAQNLLKFIAGEPIK